LATNIYHESVNDMADIKPGDTVMLRTGGPWLTVERIAEGAEGIDVVWFDGGDRIRRDTIPANCLVTQREWEDHMRRGVENFNASFDSDAKKYDA
jgi:uncharacterized protein YodC (DUF2158 family)